MSTSSTVSVVVPVYNAMPWLTECIDSIAGQTIDADRVEIIAVDDGSTDGSREELERLARACDRLAVHRLAANSGGPGHPRNLGLDHATGEYVFFADADDYLGRDALRRLVGAADERHADVVLGRIASAPGFGDRAPHSTFTDDRPEADLFDSRVYWTLNPLKLFRRSMLERVGAHFAEGLITAEDQRFTSMAYLNAEHICVLADYDYYYVRDRPEGGNATARTRTFPQQLDRIAEIGAVTERIAAHVPPGEHRDRLVSRHAGVDLLPMFRRRWYAASPQAQQTALRDAVRDWLRRWYNPGVGAHLDPGLRLIAELVAHASLTELRAGLTFGAGGEPRLSSARSTRTRLDLEVEAHGRDADAIVLRRRENEVVLPAVGEAGRIRASLRWPTLRLRPGRWAISLRLGGEDEGFPVRNGATRQAGVTIMPRVARAGRRAKGMAGRLRRG